MAGNNRVFYAAESISIGQFCTGSGIPAHGVQSASLSTTFNLQQAFELGQLDIYENIENLPSIEMNIEKCLDGYPMLLELATQGRTSPDLLSRSNQRCDIFLTLFSDSNSAASGVPIQQAYCSGMYANSISYKLPLQGPCTETLGLVGNDKLWINSVNQIWSNGSTGSGFAFNGQFTGSDAPASGIQRRWNVVMGSGAGCSVWPTNLQGITPVNGSGYNIQTNGVFGAHIQEVDISTSLNREDLLELGRVRPYFKYAKFPTAVNCTINVTAGGLIPGDGISVNGDSYNNTTDQSIYIKLADGTNFDLGTRNRLQTISYNGGSTGGEIVTISYAYQNFNHFTLTSLANPG